MTVEEANKLLGLVKVNYENAFRRMSDQDKRRLVKSWAFVFQDIPADIVALAFMQLLATSKWLPTPAEIREQIKKLHYSAVCCSLAGHGIQDSQAGRAVRYIMDSTSHLRGDGEAELDLEVILSRGYGRMLGTGKSEFLEIEPTEEK